jgi:hypothetical protein
VRKNVFGTSNLIKLILHEKERREDREGEGLVVCCLDVIDNKNKEKFISSITRIVSQVDVRGRIGLVLGQVWS